MLCISGRLYHRYFMAEVEWTHSDDYFHQQVHLRDTMLIHMYNSNTKMEIKTTTPPTRLVRFVYLPTEILELIFSFIAADRRRRQRTLHDCCLVSHQWYSAAVRYLYEKPQFNSGHAFERFTLTVSPPVGVRHVNLGQYVRRLDLSGLVHHSSNSSTARLLGRVKQNLEVFIAPKVSFS